MPPFEMFKIALDDVGSGYSSLNKLSKFYPDYIKIDLAIIRDIDKNKLQQEIFKALVAISKNTKIKVLAEGGRNKRRVRLCSSKWCRSCTRLLFW